MNLIIILTFVLFFFLSITYPCLAQVEIRQFIPKISNYSGTLEIDFAHNINESKSDGRGTERTSTRLSERIKLSASGFVYHPRFMVYRLDLSGRLTHRSFKSGAQDEGWTTGAKEEFDFRTLILPEHPYNLELYASRRAPIILGRLAKGEETVTSERGAIFNYRKRPFSLNMRYSLLTTESEDRKTDNTRYSIRVSHTEGPFSTSLGYLHSKSSGDGKKGLDDNYFFTNIIRLWKSELRSSIDYKDSEEKDIAQTEHKNLSWREDLKIDLPWNFEARLSYNHLKTIFKRVRHDIDEEQTLKIINRTDIASAELTHTLFKSLRTNISFDSIKIKSERGETKTLSGALGINYTKKIPIGRLFANYSSRRSITERTGLQFNIREVFLSDVGEGEEIILQQGADPESVSVEVKGCFFDEEGNERKITALLERDLNYSIDTEINPNRVTIIITSLLVQRGDELVQVEQCSDPDTGEPIPFEFLLTYGIAGDSKTETTSNAYSLRFDLFDGLISSYYQRVELKQKLLSGVLPYKPEDSTSEAIGITFNKPPYTLRGEYSRVISETNPSTSYKAEADYKKFITTTLHLRTRVFFVRKNLLRSERGFDREAVKREVTEDAYGASISASKRFSSYLNLSLGGSVTHRKGKAESLAYSLRGDLTWRVGKLSLRTGATVSHSKSEFRARESERMSQFYYLRIERKLF